MLKVGNFYEDCSVVLFSSEYTLLLKKQLLNKLILTKPQLCIRSWLSFVTYSLCNLFIQLGNILDYDRTNGESIDRFFDINPIDFLEL